MTQDSPGSLQGVAAYEKVCGSIPMEWGTGGDMALDCTEDWVYFRVGKEDYMLSGDGFLMPTKKGQAVPDLRYFK